MPWPSPFSEGGSWRGILRNRASSRPDFANIQSMVDRAPPPLQDDQADFFTRLTPWLAAFCLTAGLGWLVQSASDGHVHVTSKGVERHHHGHLGEHTHGASGAADHHHDHADAQRGAEDGTGGSNDSEEQSGFFSAAWVAQSGPTLPSGLPVWSATGQSAETASFIPPIRDVASEAQPRAPPVVPVPARHSRVV